MALAARGYSNAQIAEALVIGQKTVCAHMSDIYQKLHAHGRAKAIAEGKKQGYLTD